MNLEILESKVIEQRTWYLGKGNLLEYLQELKPEFYDYAIQRKIVKNQYLDKLYSTIKTGEPIPTITITYNSKTLDNINKKEAQINLLNSEILDGLQRSFRLWSYLIVSKKYKSTKSRNYREFAIELKSENPLFFDSGVMSTRLIKMLIDSGEIHKIESVLSDYDVYFTIWTGLSEKEIIQKMLVLNAGQKSVSKTHQFELLFLHFFESISKSDIGIKLYREKDNIANDIKRGNRSNGEFMFSSTIVSLQSFVEGKPLRVSTEKLIDHEFEDSEETSESVYDLIFTTRFLIYYLKKLLEIDKTITSIDKNGKEWFSKDTSLSGVFAAIGSEIDFSEIESEEELYEITEKLFSKLIIAINDQKLNLSSFTDEYNVLSSRSVNIGAFIRKVVMEYFVTLINGGKPTWNIIFNKVKERR